MERTVRRAKGLPETRPIYYKLDETIRGMSPAASLLVLKKELEDRLTAAPKSARASWPDVIADLNSLTGTDVEQDGKRFLLRSAPRRAPSLERNPSYCIVLITTRFEVICTFRGFEDFGAGFEGAQQACDGPLGDFAQEGFELGEGFFDGVHVGTVGRQISQLGARRL